jgi:hypothetical protein
MELEQHVDMKGRVDFLQPPLMPFTISRIGDQRVSNQSKSCSMLLRLRSAAFIYEGDNWCFPPSAKQKSGMKTKSGPFK